MIDPSSIQVVIANSAGEGHDVADTLWGSGASVVPRDEFMLRANSVLSQGRYREGNRYTVLTDGSYKFAPGWHTEVLGLLSPLVWAVSAPSSFDPLGSKLVAMETEKMYEIGLDRRLQFFGYEISLARRIEELGGECVCMDFPEDVLIPFEHAGRDEAVGNLYYSMIKDMQTARDPA